MGRLSLPPTTHTGGADFLKPHWSNVVSGLYATFTKFAMLCKKLS